MSTYYIDQLTIYNDKYDEAIRKIGNIYNKINNLGNAFNSASGTTVSSVKNDLAILCNDISNIKSALSKAKEITNNHAHNSDMVYEKALNEHSVTTPDFESPESTFKSTGKRKIYIEEGIIYEEETFLQTEKNPPFDLLVELGIKSRDHKYVRSVLYAIVEDMIEGKLSLGSCLSKTTTWTSSGGGGGGGGHGF